MQILGLKAEFSRDRNNEVSYAKLARYSNQKGHYTVYKYTWPGRTSFDFYEYIKLNFKLDKYSLDHVASTWIGVTKNDMKYSEISSLQKTPHGRKKIADYCLQDVNLLLELDKKKLLCLNVAMMANIFGCTIDQTLNRGVGYKLGRLTMTYTKEYKFVIPSFTESQRPEFNEKLDGAYVFAPRKGRYENPVVCLDFKSL